MKKTLITLIALAGMAAATEAERIVSSTFELTRTNTNPPIEGVTSLTWEFVNTAVGNTYTSVDLGALPDTENTTVTIAYKNGKNGAWGQTNAWANQSALEDMNTVLGLNLTTTQVGALQSMGAWGGSGDTTLAFSFHPAFVGETATFFVFTSANESGATLNVTGMSDVVSTYASATGTGFDNTLSAAKDLTLYKVTGVLNNNTIVFSSPTAKNGWSMAGFSVTAPEPAAATLSLLALAGLAARRRRH